MTDVVCPEWSSKTMAERVRNLTENELVLAVKNIDCYDWSNTGNPSQITGRVVGPGGTATWRLEVASTAYYDLGFFVRDGSGLRRVGKVNLARDKWGELSVYGYGSNSRVTTTNTGESFRTTDALCVRLLLGEDPKRTESKVSWDWRDQDATFVYSDGTNLYAVRCQSGLPGPPQGTYSRCMSWVGSSDFHMPSAIMRSRVIIRPRPGTVTNSAFAVDARSRWASAGYAQGGTADRGVVARGVVERDG